MEKESIVKKSKWMFCEVKIENAKEKGIQ